MRTLPLRFEELADGWCPADSEIRLMLDRTAELAGRLEALSLEEIA